MHAYKEPRITLVIPCYNEAERLHIEDFLNWVRETPSRHLCFVNDASTDGTAGVLNQLCDERTQTSVIHLAQNRGKAEAVRAGILRHAESDLVGFWDADLSTPLTEVENLEKIFTKDPKVQIVSGIRVLRLGATIQRTVRRHIAGRTFQTAASLMLNLPAYDTQCGAKLFQNNVAQSIFAKPFISAWMFDVELYLRLRRFHSKTDLSELVYEYPLTEWKSVKNSKLRWWDFIKAPLELWRISRHYR